METETPTNSLVLETLQKIMAMPVSQRLALRSAWDALEGAEQASSGAQGESVSVGDGAIDIAADFETWLESTRTLDKRRRVASLRQALAGEEDEIFRARLNSEISSIKNQDRKFAIELAVTDFAYEHPVLVVLALAGVGVALFRFSKSIWNLMF